tara:strand:- start:717 stop:851 length:135 start_codon:yes stop_codon:yes gene_type:complete
MKKLLQIHHKMIKRAKTSSIHYKKYTMQLEREVNNALTFIYHIF